MQNPSMASFISREMLYLLSEWRSARSTSSPSVETPPSSASAQVAVCSAFGALHSLPARIKPNRQVKGGDIGKSGHQLKKKVTKLQQPRFLPATRCAYATRILAVLLNKLRNRFRGVLQSPSIPQQRHP